MKVPVSWLREYAAIPSDMPTAELAEVLTAFDLKLEEIISSGISGPLTVGRVLTVGGLLSQTGILPAPKCAQSDDDRRHDGDNQDHPHCEHRRLSHSSADDLPHQVAGRHLELLSWIACAPGSPC